MHTVQKLSKHIKKKKKINLKKKAAKHEGFENLSNDLDTPRCGLILSTNPSHSNMNRRTLLK